MYSLTTNIHVSKVHIYLFRSPQINVKFRQLLHKNNFKYTVCTKLHSLCNFLDFCWSYLVERPVKQCIFLKFVMAGSSNHIAVANFRWKEFKTTLKHDISKKHCKILQTWLGFSLNYCKMRS